MKYHVYIKDTQRQEERLSKAGHHNTAAMIGNSFQWHLQGNYFTTPSLTVPLSKIIIIVKIESIVVENKGYIYTYIYIMLHLTR